MNNNRGNNRRRGRGGNNRPNGGGGGQQLNRVDSRARGNAPQMLEKYRKLAHDAHLNGDRVQEEYYLQFADHYFRVIADTRQRQEDQRVRRDDRWQEGGSEGDRDDGDGSLDMSGDGEYSSYDQPHQQQSHQQRDERPARENRPAREDRPAREERPARDSRGYDDASDDDTDEGTATGAGFEPAENPFVRENRTPRGEPRPRRDDNRRDGAPRDNAPREAGPRDTKPRENAPRENAPREDRRPRRAPRDQARDDAPAGLDPSMLPPAISIARAPDEDVGVAAEEAKPRKRAVRKPKPPTDDAGETLEVAG